MCRPATPLLVYLLLVFVTAVSFGKTTVSGGPLPSAIVNGVHSDPLLAVFSAPTFFHKHRRLDAVLGNSEDSISVHISSFGNDNNDGSLTSPVKTFSRGWQLATTEYHSVIELLLDPEAEVQCK